MYMPSAVRASLLPERDVLAPERFAVLDEYSRLFTRPETDAEASRRPARAAALQDDSWCLPGRRVAARLRRGSRPVMKG